MRTGFPSGGNMITKTPTSTIKQTNPTDKNKSEKTAAEAVCSNHTPTKIPFSTLLQDIQPGWHNHVPQGT